MNRNIKYKQVCRLVLNGGDDLNKNSGASACACIRGGFGTFACTSVGR